MTSEQNKAPPSKAPKITPAYKVVLSGLSENSFGCGTFKKTVWHGLVIEDFKVGRLQRKAGEFLCSPKSRPFDNGFPSHNLERAPEINCASCKALLAGRAVEIVPYADVPWKKGNIERPDSAAIAKATGAA
jgi:hypothetical protein